MFHVELSSGSVMSGQSGVEWDLSEADVRERFISRREKGEDVWLHGKGYTWSDCEFKVYEGPGTTELPEFAPALSPGLYGLRGDLIDVTGKFVHGPPGGSAGQPAEEQAGAAVFLVHGSDSRREEVARFLERMLPDENPVVILHEQPNQGQTLIEKFEANAADARFAVVLLTGDDEGGRVGDDDLERRARQNVVFELGFFFGKLGRAKVAVLYESGVVKPSDVDGLAYIPLDSEGWKLLLAKELRGADLPVDLNRM